MKFVISALLFTLVSACGSGFVEGWRDDDTTTDQQRCERRAGWLWQQDTCTRHEDADLNLVDDKSICADIHDAEWIDDECVRHSSLSEEQCSEFSDLAWSHPDWKDQRCMTLDEYACRLDGKRYKNGRCINQPAR